MNSFFDESKSSIDHYKILSMKVPITGEINEVCCFILIFVLRTFRTFIMQSILNSIFFSYFSPRVQFGIRYVSYHFYNSFFILIC